MWILSINPFFSDSWQKKKENENFLYIQYLLTRSCEESKIPSTAYASMNSSMSLKEGENTHPGFITYN